MIFSPLEKNWIFSPSKKVAALDFSSAYSLLRRKKCPSPPTKGYGRVS